MSTLTHPFQHISGKDHDRHLRRFLLVSYLVLWAQSTTKNYIRAEHKLHSISKLFFSQVIISQGMFFKPSYILQALYTGTCLRQGHLFYSAGLHRNHRWDENILSRHSWKCCEHLTSKYFWSIVIKWSLNIEISFLLTVLTWLCLLFTLFCSELWASFLLVSWWLVFGTGLEEYGVKDLSRGDPVWLTGC